MGSAFGQNKEFSSNSFFLGKTFYTVFDMLNYMIIQYKTPATFCIVKMEMLSILPDAKRYSDISIFSLN